MIVMFTVEEETTQRKTLTKLMIHQLHRDDTLKLNKKEGEKDLSLCSRVSDTAALCFNSFFELSIICLANPLCFRST